MSGIHGPVIQCSTSYASSLLLAARRQATVSSGLIPSREPLQSVQHPVLMILVEGLTRFGNAETGNENQTREARFIVTSPPRTEPRDIYCLKANLLGHGRDQPNWLVPCAAGRAKDERASMHSHALSKLTTKICSRTLEHSKIAAEVERPNQQCFM